MMIIMTLKIQYIKITEIVNQIKSNQNKRKKETQQQKSNKNTHRKEEKKKTEAEEYDNKNKTKKKTKKNKYSVTKMEQRDAKGSADSQNLISIFEKHHRCPN